MLLKDVCPSVCPSNLFNPNPNPMAPERSVEIASKCYRLDSVISPSVVKIGR